MKNCFLFGLIWIVPFFSIAQKRQIDSLGTLLSATTTDSARAELMNMLANEYLDVNVDKGISFAKQALKIGKKLKLKETQALALNVIGIAHKRKGDYPSAVKYYLKSLKIYEKLNDKEGIAHVYNNLGEVYRLQQNNEMALKYHSQALELRKELKDDQWIAASLSNLALLYSEKGENEKALELNIEALRLRKKSKDAKGISTSLVSIGNFYFSSSEFDKALTYYIESNKILDSIGDRNSMPMSLLNTGSVYYMKKKYRLTEELFLKALVIAIENKDRKWIEITYGALGELYMTTGDYKKAYINSTRSAALKDSLCGVESAAQIAEMNALYETEKKDNKINQLNRDRKIQKALTEADSKRKNIIIWSVGCGLLLLLVFSGFITRSLRLTRRQKRIIEDQKQMVEEKQQEIIDSINYAKRLQEAILPPVAEWKLAFSDCFILYKPKDIVAGDFYFLELTGNHIIFGVADCTGHGVPGAMVSVVCANALTQAVREFGLTNPGEILNKVRETVIKTFDKSSGEVNDGMDIALCAIEFQVPGSKFQDEHGAWNVKSETGAAVLRYAGANNPLWIVRNDALEEIKPDKQPVGRYIHSKPFTTHKQTLNKGDKLYMFTDGYQDQFGGDKGKKLKASFLKKYVLETNDYSMDVQKNMLDKNFENWRNTVEQVDDVCMIGLKI